MITYTKSSSLNDLKQILKLQEQNLPQTLSKKEQLQQGFLTVKHSLDILQRMQEKCPHSIVKFDNEIVGYALSMTKDFASEIPILKPMFKEISKKFDHDNYLVMGQICISKKYRGLGIFRNLYHFMRTEICKAKYDFIITEIDLRNERSLNAHNSVGFETLKNYTNEDKNWRIVFLKV